MRHRREYPAARPKGARDPAKSCSATKERPAFPVGIHIYIYIQIDRQMDGWMDRWIDGDIDIDIDIKIYIYIFP